MHHRTQGADARLLDDSLLFIEQYDALGRFFGVRGKELYDRALEHDPDDWYALHYRAFNRDAWAATSTSSSLTTSGCTEEV